MDDKQRAAAMERHSFRIAVLEVEPEMSGVPKTLHDQLKKETLRTLYPGDMADLDVEEPVAPVESPPT
jgi:hypothetical protein